MNAVAGFNVFAFPFVDEPANVEGGERIGSGAFREAYLMKAGFIRKVKYGCTSIEFNQNEAYCAATFGTSSVEFVNNGNVYTVRLAGVLQCAKDYSWIDMEYVSAPIWRYVRAEDQKEMLFHDSHLPSKLYWAGMDNYIDDTKEYGCITCDFIREVSRSFGITDMHGSNYAYDAKKKEFIVFDYGTKERY